MVEGPLSRPRSGARRLAGVAFAFAVTYFFLALAGAAHAHEKWFEDAAPFQTQWGQLFRFPSVVAIAVAVGATALAGFAWRRRGGRDLIPGPRTAGASDAALAKFYGIVPLILSVHVGLPLLVLAIRGELFSPNNRLPGAWMYWLGTLQLGIALSFLYGGLSRIAGAALFVLWLLGIGVLGLEPMLENSHYVGFAAFFFLTGRGPYSIDRLLFPRLEPTPELARRAMTSLRVATGLGLVVVSFTEKLANTDLAIAFLNNNPLNFTPWLGIPMSDELFIQCAGATELLIGLCLIFGIFPRLVVATAWLFINMTLTIFDWVELAGHLPLYGVMAVLLVWTPDEAEQRLWVTGVLGEKQNPGPA